jgi:uncharacterized protein YcbX
VAKTEKSQDACPVQFGRSNAACSLIGVYRRFLPFCISRFAIGVRRVTLGRMIALARIALYPVKSLDPVFVERARVLSSGAIENDRRFALCDLDGNVINGKRDARMHLVRSWFDASTGLLSLEIEGHGNRVALHIDRDRGAVEAWLSRHFETPVSVVENSEAGFPDDTDAPGPTIVSTATLETAASWYDGMSLDEARRRFRANLEIGGVAPFWEDRLFAADGRVVRFSVGAILLEGTNPCARCVVPSRSSMTGIAEPLFQKTFANRRQSLLPAWAETSRFDHFYRLAVNTRPVVSTLPGEICVGDAVTIEGPCPR